MSQREGFCKNCWSCIKPCFRQDEGDIDEFLDENQALMDKLKEIEDAEVDKDTIEDKPT